MCLENGVSTELHLPGLSQGRDSRTQTKCHHSADTSWGCLKGSTSGTDINMQGTHKDSLRKAISLPEFFVSGLGFPFFFFVDWGKMTNFLIFSDSVSETIAPNGRPGLYLLASHTEIKSD